jgi:hypothetical protein
MTRSKLCLMIFLRQSPLNHIDRVRCTRRQAFLILAILYGTVNAIAGVTFSVLVLQRHYDSTYKL